jgi:hypothetical protein
MNKIISYFSLFFFLWAASTGIHAQALDQLYDWNGFEYDSQTGTMKQPKYAKLKTGDKLIIKASGNTYLIDKPGLVITNHEAFDNLYFEKLKLDSLSKATGEYIDLQKEVNALQKEIAAQKDSIIQIQDVSYQAQRMMADSLASLTERSMANTDRAVDTITRAQRRTWLFTIGGVAVGATIGLIAGAFIN